MRGRFLAAVILAGLAIAEPVQAARVEVTAGAVVYTAAPGEINRVGIGRGQGPGQILLYDSSDVYPGAVSARVDAVEPCRLAGGPPPTARAAVFHGLPVPVECPARPSIVVVLGDHGDSLAIEATLSTSDRVDAGSGDDSVATAEGADVLLGGPGRDTLVGGLGPDRVEGGPDIDDARYDLDDRRTGIVATTRGGADDGSAQDGPPGRRDALVGVEGIRGTAFADVLSGDGRANVLVGGEGADRLTGDAGADSLLGGDGRDVLSAGAGDDALDSRDDAAERVACGRGDDLLAGDPSDRVGSDCETVGLARKNTFDAPMEIGPRARLSRSGRLLVRVGCPSGLACEGSISLTADGRGAGRAVLDVEPGKTRSVAIRVRRSASRDRSFVVRTTTGEGKFEQRTTRRVRVSGAAPARKRA